MRYLDDVRHAERRRAALFRYQLDGFRDQLGELEHQAEADCMGDAAGKLRELGVDMDELILGLTEAIETLEGVRRPAPAEANQPQLEEVRCPYCNRRLFDRKPGRTRLGLTIRCPKCGKDSSY